METMTDYNVTRLVDAGYRQIYRRSLRARLIELQRKYRHAPEVCTELGAIGATSAARLSALRALRCIRLERQS
jgi:hypothetical protein